jgi:DNA processing protein
VESDHAIANAIALASLRGMGPGRLDAIRRAWGFDEGWERVRRGQVLDEPDVVRSLGIDPSSVVRQWQVAARGVEPARLLDAHRAAGVQVMIGDSDRYPDALSGDIDAPALLFARGDLSALDGRRVAIVGTRRCTRSGRQTALEMANGLAEAGVQIVSGLALGIDGAAHEGALRSHRPRPVVGVVGTGLDVVYPRRHQALWHAVIERGVLISEVPLGGGPLPWRFPARNRIIAALAEVVVVVESHATGGALHTVDEAERRDRLVVAVPGSVRSPAAAGTNALLHEGAGPVRDAADVLTALGFAGVSAPSAAVARTSEPPPTPPLSPVERRVLDHLDGAPASVDQLATATGVGLAELALALLNLERGGLIARSGSRLERLR